jgi:hypothetical protein
MGFRSDGSLESDFHSTLGPPTVLLLQPTNDFGWLGTFEACGIGDITGVFAGPASYQLCVVAQGLSYCVDLRSPRRGASIVQEAVTQVERVIGRDLLLFVTFSDIVALGPTGVAWKTSRVAWDGLVVPTADADSIQCTADALCAIDRVVLDTDTGRQTEGIWLER